MGRCSHCGKQRTTLKRCSRCQQASYCGAECQNAAWKGHKKSCVSLDDVVEKVNAAGLRKDWREVLKWEGRMEDMMERQPDAECSVILGVFANAHCGAINSTGSSLSIVRLETRRVEVLGRMQRFRDQGQLMCVVADHLRVLGKTQEAAGYFQRARKLGEEHGFFLLECESCFGLGRLAMAEGRTEEGLELLRNAMVCVPLCEVDASGLELSVLRLLTDALFHAHAIDEVEPLVARFREAARAESDRQGRPCFHGFYSLYTSARLHEVLCTCTPRVGIPFTQLCPCMSPSTKIDGVFHRIHIAWLKTHALVESCAPSRHARDLKRPRGRCALCSTSCARMRQQCTTSPLNFDTCCITSAWTSRSLARSMGRRSSSSQWQPKWLDCRRICVNPKP